MSGSDGVSSWFSRPVQGVLVIALLVLLLAIPIMMIRGIIFERVEARDDAVAEVTATWGTAQSIIGPRLAVPFRRPPADGEEGWQTGTLSMLPASLDVVSSVTAESLSRGLFAVPVYEARVTLSGRFDADDVRSLGMNPSDLMWNEASLVVEVSEPKTVGDASTASWEGAAVELLPGAPGSAEGGRGVHARVPPLQEGGADFEVSLDLKGSEALWFVPFSRSTHVSLTSNWPHPSFSGAWLPEDRAVQSEGFTADWDVPFLGRDYGQTWTDLTDPHAQVLLSRFGVELITPVDHYRMSERSTKYAQLFIALTFGLLWLFDTLVGVRIHPIQYLLVGGALCVFYLLELSLSEQIGFIPAYGVAAVAVVTLITSYSRSVLGSTVRGALMAGSTSLLYAYLFALLTLERYALLVGSLGLFSALATVMHLTRSIDWHRMRPSREAVKS